MECITDSIDRWLTRYKKCSVKAATYDRLITSLQLLKAYDIATRSITNLTAQDIQIYVNQLVADGYSLSTIRKQFFLLSGYLEYEFQNGTIARPIYKQVKMPTKTAVIKPSKDIQAYSKEQQQRLVSVFNTDARPGYFAAWLMLQTGMRVGEVLALTWADVDAKRRSVRVNKTLIRIANKHKIIVQNGAKSYTSNRTIPLSATALKILERIPRSRQSIYIFHDRLGAPLSYEALRYQIGKACEQADVPYLGQHVFRHTFATNCYEKGCDVKILSKMLGHADVTITYNIYIHLYGDALEQMRRVVE